MLEQNKIQIIITAFQGANARGDECDANNWDNDGLVGFLDGGPYVFDDEKLIEMASEIDIQDSDAMTHFMNKMFDSFKAADPEFCQDDAEAQKELLGAFVNHFELGDLVEISAWRRLNSFSRFDRETFQFQVLAPNAADVSETTTKVRRHGPGRSHH